jgi:hypothetical protein
VRYCLRKYVETLDVGTAPRFATEIDKLNWVSCHDVVSKLSSSEQQLVQYLYGPGDTLPDKIYHIAQAKRTTQGPLWKLVDEVEYSIAKQRGMI